MVLIAIVDKAERLLRLEGEEEEHPSPRRIAIVDKAERLLRRSFMVSSLYMAVPFIAIVDKAERLLRPAHFIDLPLEILGADCNR